MNRLQAAELTIGQMNFEEPLPCHWDVRAVDGNLVDLYVMPNEQVPLFEQLAQQLPSNIKIKIEKGDKSSLIHIKEND